MAGVVAQLKYHYIGGKAGSRDQIISEVTLKLILAILKRDQAGKAKYGTTLDRTDLTKEQWLDHMTEELLDAAGYAQAAKKAAGKMA